MRTFIAICLLIAAQCINAQTTFEKRLEFDLKDGYENETIFEFGKDGILLRSSSEEGDDNDMIEYKYDKYNTNLELVSTKSEKLEYDLDLDMSRTTKTSVHTFLKDKRGNYAILSANPATMEITTVKGVLPKNVYTLDMAILGDYAYITGTMKGAPYIFTINWKTGERNFIPVIIEGYKPTRIAIQEFEVLESSREVFLYVKAENKEEENLFVIKLDKMGEKKSIFTITKELDKNLVNVTATHLGGDRYIFTGTYSSESMTTSAGVFFCEVQGETLNFIKFYNYTKLKTYFKYLPERKQEKIEKKAEKKEKAGKELELDYLIASHPVIPLKDGYLFLGEAFYPTYRTETYTSYVNGQPVTRTRQVFDGYQYTHASLVKFDKNGELVWDQSFVMFPSYKPFYVKQFISIPQQPVNSIDMVFASNNTIEAKSVDFEGNEIDKPKVTQIENTYEGDKAKYTFSNLEYWYQGYYVAYGSQLIKNKDDDNVKRKRRVFFISKIRYDK
jgi:hypothetical protein